MNRFTTPMLCAAALLTACDRDSDRAASTGPLFARDAGPAGFVTSETPQAYAVAPGGTVTPIITVGDRLPSGYVFPPIPDGLGAYQDGQDLIVYANHELTAGGVTDQSGAAQFRNARVSRLVIDRASLAVRDATLVLDGTEQYVRLCSATWVGAAEGFPSGYFLTGEESSGGAHDGAQLGSCSRGSTTPPGGPSSTCTWRRRRPTCSRAPERCTCSSRPRRHTRDS